MTTFTAFLDATLSFRVLHRRQALYTVVYTAKAALRSPQITISELGRTRQGEGIHAELAESSIMSNIPHLTNLIPIRQPNSPFRFLTCTHPHPHRAMNHSPVHPFSTAQMNLFQPIWQ